MPGLREARFGQVGESMASTHTTQKKIGDRWYFLCNDDEYRTFLRPEVGLTEREWEYLKKKAKDLGCKSPIVYLETLARISLEDQMEGEEDDENDKSP